MTRSSRSAPQTERIVWEAGVAITAPLCARDGWLIALSGGNVLAFRAADGARVWQKDIGATTVRPGIGDDKFYVALDDARMVALAVEQRRRGLDSVRSAARPRSRS